MAEFLYQIDVSVFYFINHTISNPLFDKFVPFVTDVKHWYITYIVLFFILTIKGGRTGRIAAVVFLILITATDQFSSAFLKHLIGRIRPCNVLPDVRILVTCTESFSFPSSHAVNNFAAAIFFSKIYPKFKWTFFIVATLMALSRPYVGVHYPSDIVGGALIGIVFGYIFAYMAMKIDNILKERKTKITDKYERVEYK
ncbi:MAG: phosphatase PAP2 family protein [Bacteroidetes bacterium]|nr:phosphatase PAP2 family protein [Bacteroidota bacterium]